MCTDLLRRVAGLGLAGLLVLPLAGCTVEGPGSWRYRGDPLLQAEKDLAAITEVWREHVRTERGPRALPADSACYLRISAPHDVDDEVVCGPLIVRGPRWESASIASYYERDGKVALTLTGSPEDAFSPVADAGSEGPLRWFRGGSAIAGYTSSTVTLVDPVLEVDGVAHPVRAETDDLTGDPMVQESIFIAPEAEARLTLRGTLRIELSQPIAVPGPGYDGTVPEGVPGSAVVELPMEQGVGIAPVVGDRGLRQAW